jgi:hypothetical protein
LGLEGVVDVVDEGITGVGRPSNGNNIEADGDLSQGSIALEEGEGSICQFLLFARVDRGDDLLKRFRSGGLSRADLDNDQGLPV